MPEDPICVIATSVADGNDFAERLGLQNYQVYTNMLTRSMEGRRFREIVVTTEFVTNIFDVMGVGTRALNMARYSMQKRADGPNY